MKILYFPENRTAGVPFYRQYQLLDYLKTKGHTIEEMVDLKNNTKSVKKAKEQLMDADFLWIISPVSILMREALALWIKDNMTEVVLRVSGCPINMFKANRLSYKDLRILVDFDDEPIIAMPQSNDYLHRGHKDVYVTNPDGSVTEIWKRGEKYDDTIFNPSGNYVNIKTRIDILKLAHVLTSPSELILKGFGRFNPAQDLLLLPNAIDFSKIGKFKPSTDGKLRILWSMGATHILDFLAMEDAFASLMEKDQRIILVTWGQYFKSSKIPNERREHHNFVTGVHKYYARMNKVTADIGFAYVVNNRFNRCKSPVKVEEYYAAGLPVICGKTLYEKTIDTSHAVYVIGNPNEIDNAIKAYGNMDIPKLTADAYEYCRANYSIEVIGDYAEALLLELTSKPLYPILEKQVIDSLSNSSIETPKLLLPNGESV